MVLAVPLQILICMGGLPYIVIDNILSASGFTRVSKKGMIPSCLVSPTVNFIARPTLSMCSRKFCLFSFFWMTKVSSTNLSHSLGVSGAIEGFLLKIFHVEASHYKGLLVTP